MSDVVSVFVDNGSHHSSIKHRSGMRKLKIEQRVNSISSIINGGVKRQKLNPENLEIT